MVISCNVTFYFQFLQFAQQSGHKRCNEIFSVLTKNHRLKLAGKHGWSQQSKCLYLAGFRLIDTKASSVLSDICLLVYKPDLIPNFQVEDGVVGDYVETSAVLNICEDLITSLSVTEEGRLEAQCIQSCMKTVNESSTLMLSAVQSSFPWNGNIFCIYILVNLCLGDSMVVWLPVTCVQIVVYSLARVVLAVVPSSMPHGF